MVSLQGLLGIQETRKAEDNAAMSLVHEALKLSSSLQECDLDSSGPLETSS
jgi:hypothetical protein